MKKMVLSFLAIATIASSVQAEERTVPGRGDCAGYASRDASTLSMMGWGVSLAVGVAALVCLIPNHASAGH